MFQTTTSNQKKPHRPSEAQKRHFLGSLIFRLILVVFFFTSILSVLCLQADGKVFGSDQIWLHLLSVPWSQQERFMQLGAAAGAGWLGLGHSRQLWEDVLYL